MTARTSVSHFATELRWAWRGVRRRGWRGGIVIVLLAIALASNATMFSVADSLVFNREPFPGAARVVDLRGATTAPETINRAATQTIFDEWRKQTDIFTAVGGYLQKTVFVIDDAGANQPVRTADVTLEFFDVLGVTPRWGRPFRGGDDRDSGTFVAVISERLARERFGHPTRAINQTLKATAGPMVIVGVMDRSFAYPNDSFQIWRALDPRGPLAQNFAGVPAMGRVAEGVPLDRLDALLAQRASIVGAAAGLRSYRVTASPFVVQVGVSAERQAMLYVLLGAATCLLLAACANVTSLELAGALKRARVAAIQRALGAPRWSLARTAALEGLLLIGAGLAAGVGLALLFIDVVAANLTDELRIRTANPIDLDGRAMLFMSATAIVAWLVGTLPAAVAASRTSLVSLFKAVDRGSAASRGATWLRRGLTVTEVALAVALVIGGLLYARTYQELLAVEKGFDSRGLVQITYTMPSQFFANSGESRPLGERVIERLRQVPGVLAGTSSSPPPSTGDSPSSIKLEIDGGPPAESPIYLGAKWVDASYFDVIRLPVRSGRRLRADDPETNIVLPESAARRFFTNGDAVGHSIRLDPRQPWMTIVGVVGDFRSARTQMPQPTDSSTYYYRQWRPPAPAAPTRQPIRFDTGGSTGFTTVTMLTDSSIPVERLLDEARRIEPRLQVTAIDVDAIYARQSADTRLTSQIVGAFSVLATVVALAGVFSVMSFLVAGRTREIGIRMALGADRGTIARSVIESSGRMVLIGTAAGTGLALLASRWMASQLFGVSATDPIVYTVVPLAVLAVSLAASWWPARQAARVDPAITLRSE
jgi:putative ABC transport system permease protein